ncbi:hypothetical protein HGG75_17930 [Ochrobactrum pseudogrignonense]|nr:hypothetical protein [Brucella pseudogrignonensis]
MTGGPSGQRNHCRFDQRLQLSARGSIARLHRDRLHHPAVKARGTGMLASGATSPASRPRSSLPSIRAMLSRRMPMRSLDSGSLSGWQPIAPVMSMQPAELGAVTATSMLAISMA